MCISGIVSAFQRTAQTPAEIDKGRKKRQASIRRTFRAATTYLPALSAETVAIASCIAGGPFEIPTLEQEKDEAMKASSPKLPLPDTSRAVNAILREAQRIAPPFRLLGLVFLLSMVGFPLSQLLSISVLIRLATCGISFGATGLYALTLEL